MLDAEVNASSSCRSNLKISHVSKFQAVSICIHFTPPPRRYARCCMFSAVLVRMNSLRTDRLVIRAGEGD